MQDLIKTSSEWHSGTAQEADRAVYPGNGYSPAPAGARGGRGGEGRGAGGGGRVARGGERRRPRRGGRSRWPLGSQPSGSTGQTYSVSQYTEEERNNAKLPLPPEQDSEVQVLLRPGLLADVEIQVEKIPDAMHVPAQAVFEKNGKPTVFVQQKNKRFVPGSAARKQSESMMVLASGYKWAIS